MKGLNQLSQRIRQSEIRIMSVECEKVRGMPQRAPRSRRIISE